MKFHLLLVDFHGGGAAKRIRTLTHALRIRGRLCGLISINKLQTANAVYTCKSRRISAVLVQNGLQQIRRPHRGIRIHL